MTNSHELTQANVEQGLLGAIGISLERLLLVQETLSSEDFIAWSPVFDFIVEYAGRFGNPPSHDEILSRFDDWYPPVGEFDYWLDELNRYTLARKAQMAIRDVLPAIEDAPEAAVQDLVGRLSVLRSRVVRHVSPTTETIDLRISELERRFELGAQFQGIPTGLKPIDDTGMGWTKGEVIGILARPSVGKTWTLIREGVIAWFNGARVVCVSPEMPATQTERRVDVVMAGIMGINISHQAIARSDGHQLPAYRQLKEAIEAEAGQWYTIDSQDGERLGPRAIGNYAQQYGADIILIDGVSFLEDDRKGDSEWRIMKNVSMDLKQLAIRLGVPIIINHWAVNSNKGRRSNANDATVGRGDDWIMPTMNDAAFGDSFVGVTDTLITMVGDRDSRYFTWYSIRKTRDRELESYHNRLPLGWLVDRGLIIDYSEHGSEPVWDELYKDFRNRTGVDPDA